MHHHYPQVVPFKQGWKALGVQSNKHMLLKSPWQMRNQQMFVWAVPDVHDPTQTVVYNLKRL